MDYVIVFALAWFAGKYGWIGKAWRFVSEKVHG